MKGKSRCKTCDALQHRIARVDPCAADGSSCLDKFNNISNVARADFFKKNAHKFKDELRKEIETVVKMISTSVVEFGWEGTGELMDSPDLKKKYEHNPKRLKAIMTKARRVQCPSTDIMMYEDLKIVTHAGESNKRQREQIDTITQHSSERGAAKKKPGQAKKALQDDNHMSEAQLKTLGTMKDWYTEGLVSLVKFNTDASAYDEHVPKTIKTRLAEAKETCDLALAELNVAIEHAACGKDEFIQLGLKQKESKKEVAALEAKLKTLLKDVRPKEDNPDTKPKKPNAKTDKRRKK